MLSRLALLLLVACGSQKDDGGGKKERPAPITVAVNKVEQLESVAANETYAAQGLGAKAPDGKTFVCVQYTVTNTGDKGETLPAPNLVDGKGAKHQLSMTTAGKYMPADWPTDSTPPKLEPKKPYKQHHCFEVAKDATAGMKLELVDTGWGPKFPPWQTSVAL